MAHFRRLDHPMDRQWTGRGVLTTRRLCCIHANMAKGLCMGIGNIFTQLVLFSSHWSTSPQPIGESVFTAVFLLVIFPSFLYAVYHPVL